MANRESLSCFIIGGDTLLTECGQILLQQGHEIRGVITATPRIAQWATQKGITVYHPKSDYRASLKERPFDYLFAITHLAIIPDDILAIPQRGAINFHDGPLPRYAGLNTPAWALMNREPAYGITFHAMTAGVDKGDILKQKLFDVAPGETSLSLNTRCFGQAIDAFSELVEELVSGTFSRTPQTFEERSYFSKFQRPPAACVIDWTRPAVEIEALVRALDFGRYTNPLGAAKVLRGAQVLIVTRAELRPEDESSAVPGTVVGIDGNEVRVATGEGVLALLGFQNLGGIEVPGTDVVTRLGLAEGERFDLVSPEVADRLTALNQQLARSEEHWVTRLSRLEPIEIPYAATHGGASRLEQVQLEVPGTFLRFGVDGVVAAYAAYLARIGNKESFHLAYADAGLRAETQGLETLVSTEQIAEIGLNLAEGFEATLPKITAELAELKKRRSWLFDLVARHPELHARPELAGGRVLGVGLALGEVPGTQLDRLDRQVPGTTLSLAVSGDGSRVSLVYDASVLSAEAAQRIRSQLLHLMNAAAADPRRPIGELDLLGDEERRRVLAEWNQTERGFRTDACVHQLFEEQVERSPEVVAAIFENDALTYRELNQRANRLAHHLRQLEVGPDRLVGVFVERSLELIVSILAIQKAGGAYLPLDPAYPKDRIAFMIEDSKVGVILAQERLVAELPRNDAKVVRVDADWPSISAHSPENPESGVTPANLAYVIYTSGSTGRPKGVQVEHRNVANFFTGMDERIGRPDGRKVWLAVTSLSFDISVLELFYTVTRGFTVVIFLDRRGDAGVVPGTGSTRGMEFGLFYWGNDDGEGSKKYELLLQGARFADQNGFNSVWTPERHFHAFGGPYPNPAVTGAAVAAVTSKVRIRAGSCVSPLHHSVRIAEEWAVIDNLSNGRVDLSFAAGWQPNDFVFRPENYKNAKAVMIRQIDEVCRLWRGEGLEFANGRGDMIEVKTQPRPVQKELPYWVTTAGNPETYREAGRLGANVLTHLLGQSVDEVAEKIKIYREARAAAGLDPAAGKVTLMLHTYVGDDDDEVREIVRQPMKDYLGASVSLVKNYAWAFPAFKRPQGASQPDDINLQALSGDELDGILEFAFERYFETSGLFGSVETCSAMVERLKVIGVDDIACLIDFGVATQTVLKMLPALATLRERSNVVRSGSGEDMSLPAQVRRHGVNYLQCTPSMARMLTMSDESREALRQIEHLMVGGEALPVELARELCSAVPGTVTNMYGPTETCIWSSTHPVRGEPGSIPIGKPIANTQLYILDARRQPVPVGVPGELYIAGAGVVRGYLHRPELTAERFLPDPFASGSGARMYRTGDLVKWRDDGVVEFLGRTDHQVKIRGYRIELGEIETQLSRHPLVRECVVIVREDKPGDQRLIAYLVPHGKASSGDELRDYLRGKLPEYMVPGYFAVLDALPLTPNGKIDRKALPAPESLQADSKVEYVAPTNEIEEKIAKLWMETLGKEKVGVDDNFFDIGGHSLLVVRVHRQLKDVVEKPIALTDLYRFPTIRTLTEYLQSDGASAAMQASTDRAARRRELMQKRRPRRDA